LKKKAILEKKRILITGGAGFIGSHLCEYLLHQGNTVICLDNFSTGFRRNIDHLLHGQYENKIHIIKDDINERFVISGAIDEIYHLACPASPKAYQYDPVKTIRTNTIGTANILELAKKKSAKILFTSTSEIYGDPLEHPQSEGYFGNVNPLSIRACYDEGKRCAETLCMDYHRQYGVDVKIIRIFNTYGPRMAEDDGRVVSNFIVQALRGEPITLYGDGSQTRSFQYIDDLVRGMVLMMDKDNFVGPVNLGNPDEFTIGELAEKIKKLTNSLSNIIYEPLPEADPRQRCPDITLAKKKLLWSPKFRLENGLKRTIEYFREHIVT